MPPQAKKLTIDAEAANKAGIKAVGVLSGGFPRDQLLKAGYEKIYRDPNDLFQNFDESLFHLERPPKGEDSSFFLNEGRK